MKRSKQRSRSVFRTPARARRRRLGFEVFESRRLLALITWTGGAGTFDWGTAGNWLSDTNTAVVPGASDDVIIPSLAGSQTITIASGARAAKTIQVGGDEKLRITGGTLTVSAAEAILKGTGSFEVAGGTLALAGNGWSNTSTLVLSSGTLNLDGSFTQPSLGTFLRSSGNVYITGTISQGLSLDTTTGPWYLAGGTISGGTITTDGINNLIPVGLGFSYLRNGVRIAPGSVLDMSQGSALYSRVQVFDGLTIDGTLLLGSPTAGGNSSVLYLNNSQTVGGTGSLVFGLSSNVGIATSVQGPITFNFGPNLAIRGKSIVLTGEGSAASNPTYNLQGPINVEAGGAGLSVTGGVGVLNTSSGITLISGTGCAIAARTWNHTGTLTAPGSNTLTIGATSLLNAGSITTANSTVNLGGVFTQSQLGSATPSPGHGTFTRFGGTVNITGTLNDGLTLDASTGPWYLAGGTISGGTITTDGVNNLIPVGFGFSYLRNGVRVAPGSVLDMSQGSALYSRVQVFDGLTIDGTLLLGSPTTGGNLSALYLNNYQTIDGSGSLVFGLSSNVGIATNVQGPITFNFGPNLAIRGKSIVLTGEGSAASNPTYNLQGPINVEAGGAGLSVTGGVGMLNTSGSITLAQATSMSILAKNWTNLPTGEVIANQNGTLQISEGTKNWTNEGLIQVIGATVSLGGNITQADIGVIQRDPIQPGSVTLVGTLTGPLTLAPATGDWRFGGSGRLKDSTLIVHPSVKLESAGFFTFDNVHIAAGTDVIIASSHLFLTIANGLTLNGRLLLGDNATSYGQLVSDYRLAGNGSQTISGNGRIEFNHQANIIQSNFNSPATGGTLVIGPGITLAGQDPAAMNERIRFEGTGSFELHGTIEIDGATASMDIGPFGGASFTNSGTIRSTLGTLNIRPTSFINNAAGEVVTSGGSFLIGGDATQNRTWTNQGLIQVSATTVSLGGNFTQVSMGTFQRDAAQPGTVTLVGNLTGDLSLTPATGDWRFGGGGRLNDSTLTVDPSVEFGSSGFFTFDNVHVAADSKITVASSHLFLTIVNGLTLNGRLLLGDNATSYGQLVSDYRLSGSGSQTISGNGRIEFNHQSNNIRSSFTNPATGGTLVIGHGITLAGQDPAATNERLHFEGNGSFELNGTVEVDGATASIDIGPFGGASFTNAGTIRSTLGTLNIRPTSFINNAAGEVSTSGGSFLIGGDATQNRTWTNQGLIQVVGTTVSLGGNFTQAGLGTFQRDPILPGTVKLVGNIDGDLTLNSGTGSWDARENGRLRNGTLTVEPNVEFRVNGSFTFDNAAIASDSVVTVVSVGGIGALGITNGLTIEDDGELRLGDASNFGSLISDQRQSGPNTQMIDGTGSITFNSLGNTLSSVFNSPATSGELVIGAGITLSGERLQIGGTNGSIILEGTLDVSGAGRRADIAVSRFENRGTLRATNAAVIDVRPTTFVNFADVTNRGSNRFGVTLQGGTFEANDGTIRLFQGTNTAHSFVLKKLEAELILAGTTPRIYGHTTNTTSAIAELAEIGTAGALRLRKGVFYGPVGEVLVRGEVDVDATSRFGNAPSAPITTVGLKSYFAANGNYANSAAGAESLVATPENGSGFSTGLDGQGFSFDGVNDHVTIPANSSLNNRNLTVSAWYKLDQLPTGLRVLLGKTIGGGTLNSYAVWLNGDSINYGIGNGTGFDWQSVALVRQVDRWNHVALAFDDNANLVQLYHNGSLLDSFTSTRTIDWDPGRPHVLGADIENGNPAYFFPGVIDEVRHYDRALSASEISDIAADTPLVATTIRQADGIVRVGGTLASYGEYRLEGGTLFGVGSLPTSLNQTGGTLAPGNSPGCMEIDGDYVLATGGELQIEIEGATVCTQYDQLQVSGNVTLGGTLDVVLDPSFSPTIGQKFLILDNDQDDPIIGQFQYAGSVLRERQVFLVNGNQLFRISYTAGDGNDVELEFLGKGALVSNTDDSGPGSLRQAVEDANLSPGHDLIAFAIDDALQVNGRYLIESTGLDVTDATTINATTQYDFSGVPVVELRDQLGNSATGLAFSLGFVRGSEVRGLSMTGWATGILINYEDVLIAGNYFGIALDGSIGGGNGVGIEVAYVIDPAVRIGGTASSERNIIANSTFAGIYILANGVIVEGNYIGTDPTGLLARPNQRGIYIERTFLQPTDNNTIGGSATGAGNLISGNTLAGIEFDANGYYASGNIVEGNWIGLDSTGNAALPNGTGIILIESEIGTLESIATLNSNIISGNSTHGILISGSSQNTIAGNIIGLNAAGSAAVPNLNHGIAIENGSENNIIGGLNAAERNIISGNGIFGVSLVTSNGNRILGNYLGTDVTGEIELTNGAVAIGLNNSNFTEIGLSGGNINGNLIIGESFAQIGIDVSNQSNQNSIVANRFGLSASNQSLGYLGNAIAIIDSDQNVVGGATSAERNVLVQYSGHGVILANGSESNVIVGNYVGVHPNGETAIFTEQHSTYGIAILNSSNNSIGLAGSGTGNLVGGNENGVFVAGVESVGNSVDGNWVGLSAAGTAPIPNETGILIGDARNTSVGTNAPNIVSGNRIGIEVSTVATRDTLVANNWIGTDGTGATASGIALGNSESGIRHVGGLRTLIRDNTVVGSGPYGPFSNPYGAVDVLGGDAVLSQNRIFNNFVQSIRTDAFPGTITITQARLDGFVLGEISGATPFTTFTVEFFEADDNNIAERFVGTGFLVTDENGGTEFEISDLGDLTPGKFITATITGAVTEGDSNFNTSSIGSGAIPQVALIRGLPTRSPEGTPINLQAFAVDSTETGFAITGYVWEVLKDGEFYVEGNEAGIQFAPDDEGVYTVRLKLTLTNTTGEQKIEVLGPHNINVFNVAPTPQFEIDPYQALIGQAINLRSSSTDPGRDDVLIHSWEVRYGSPTGDVVHSVGPGAEFTTTTFTPDAGGNYYIKLTVDDSDGGSTGARSLTRLLQVRGLPSATSIIVPSSGSEGQTIRARAPETELQRAEELTFTWSMLKNGSNYEDFTSPSPGVIEFIPDDDGTYVVKLTVSDGTGSLPEISRNVVVTNASPVVSVQGFSGVAELGQDLVFTADIFDPGTADTHEVSWVVDRQGAVVSSDVGSSFTFTPSLAGVYKIIATATDDDYDSATGVGRSTGERVIYVADSSQGLIVLPPTEPSGGFVEGDSYEFSASVPNLPSGVTVSSYQWWALDLRGRLIQSVSGSGPSISNYQFMPPSGGEFLAVLDVLFSDGRNVRAVSQPIIVQGLAPEISSIDLVSHATNQQVFEGDAVRVRTSAFDAGEHIGLTYRWELMRPGAGWVEVAAVASRPSEVTFTPWNQGVHRVRVTVSDNEGLSVTQELSRFSALGIDVQNALPTVQLSVDGNTSTEVTFKALAQDPGLNDRPLLAYSWSVNGGAFSTPPSATSTFTANLVGLSRLAVRVHDDTGYTEVRSYILLGTDTNDSYTISVSDAAAAVGVGAQQLIYLALDGDDTITVNAGISIPVLVFGGAGNDTLNASTATGPVILDGGEGDDTLRGGSGNDRLIAGPGTNWLHGGDGNNVFVGGGSDTMIGGSGDDYYFVHFSEVVIQDTTGGKNTVDLSLASQGVTLDFGSTTGLAQTVFPGSTLSLEGNFETLVGSPHNDRLSTNKPGTKLISGGGNDRLVASSTDVTLDGGAGNSELVLANASGTFIAGGGLSTISGTLAADTSSTIELRDGGGSIDVVGASPTGTASLAEVKIIGGAGNSSITAERVSGKIYAYQGSESGAISEFGAATNPATRTTTVNNSSDIEIFGSARPGNTIVVSQSQDIDIFGTAGDSAQLSNVIRGTIDGSLFGAVNPVTPFTATVNASADIDIFGSVRPLSALVTTINNSSDIDIFGSAHNVSQVTVRGGQDIDIFGVADGSILFDTDSLGNSPRRATVRISDFGSATPRSLPITITSSQEIDIFGSASPTGSPLTAVIHASSDIDIFGAAARQTSIVATGSSDIDIFGVLDGEIRLGPEDGSSTLDAVTRAVIEASGFGAAGPGTQLNVTIHNSSEIDIFGGVSPNSATLMANVVNSSDIDIFGSVRGGTIQATSSQDIDIYGQGSDTVTLTDVDRAAIFTQVFGSSAPRSPLQVSIVNNSSDIDIFGSANRNASIEVTSSSDIDIFGGTAETELAGGTIWGDEVLLSGVERARVVAGVFGSAVTTQTISNVTIGGNSSDIEIFGSGLGRTQVVVSQSQDIDIFGAFGDTISLDEAQRVRIEGGLFGAGTPGVKGLTATVVGNSQDIDIFGTSVDDLVDISGGSSYRLALRDGADELTISDVQNLIAVFDEGDDAVVVESGSDMLLYMAGGRDRAEVRGGENIRLIGGDGNDQFLITGGHQVDLDGGSGDDLVVLVDGTSTIIRLDGGENDLRLMGGVGALAVGGASSDRMTVYGKLGNTLSQGQVYAVLDGGDGDDYLSVLPLFSADDPQRDSAFDPLESLPTWMKLPQRITSPVSTTFASSVALIGGMGNDTLTLSGNQRLFAFGGDGDDHINLLTGSTSTISGGDGADTFEVYSPGLGNYVFGGGGNDQVTIYRGTKVGVFTEAGDDQVTFDSVVDPALGVTVFSRQSFARGGLGNDHFSILAGAGILVAGEVGRNTIEVLGGQDIIGAGGIGHDTLRVLAGAAVLLLGEGGHDELEYHGGTDVILSGGDGDDRLTAYQQDVQLYGDDGDDWYAIGDFAEEGTVLIRELIFLDGQNFEAEARGSDTIDLSRIVLAGTEDATLDLSLLDAVQTVIPGRVTLKLVGSIENIVGTDGDDRLYGNDEANRLDGGGGNDQLYGFGGDDILIGGDGNNTLVGGDGDDQYLIFYPTNMVPSSQRIVEGSGQGIDRIDFFDLPIGLGAASHFFSLASSAVQNIAGGMISVTLNSGLEPGSEAGEIEELTGTAFDDFVLGNALDNRFEMLGGNDTVDGVGGDDLYVFVGSQLGSLVLQDEANNTGRRTLDFAAFDAPLDIDLSISRPQNLGDQLLLTLVDPLAFHNVVGTSFDDRIFGNANDNALYGAAGRDYLDGREGNDRIYGDLPQVVLLDFDTAFRAERGDYEYTSEQRSQILTLVADRFTAFNWRFTLDEAEAKNWTRDSGRTFVRLNFSEGRGGGVSGDAGEIDFRNINRGLISQVNINSLKDSIPAILSEITGKAPTPEDIAEAIVRLSAHIAAHELGHTAGLRHADALGPIGSGFYSGADLSQVYPVYSGPLAADETVHHLIASPASLGTTIANALGQTFWGVRESIKLAFNEQGRTIGESNSSFNSHQHLDNTAQDLGELAPLYVPNLAPAIGHSYSGSVFQVSAIAVIGRLAFEENGTETYTERDVYRFQGNAGEWVNLEVLANGIRPMRGKLFDGQIRLYDSSGQLIGWNDDEFEGTKDAVLFDVQLPETGEYFVEVSLSDQPAIDAPGDRYELFISRFRLLENGESLPVVPGDTFRGGLGENELHGSPADDFFFATEAAGVDTIFGEAGFDTLDILGLDYHYDPARLDSVEQIVNENIAPHATLTGVPTTPINTSSVWTASLVDPSDPSVNDTTAGFRYAFALKRSNGSIAQGSLPITWMDATAENEREFGASQVGSYTLVARIFDVRNGYRDYEANVTVEGAANQAPTDIILDNATIAENQPAGTIVGNLSAEDPDSNESHQFELVAGSGDSDNGAFEIVGNQLRAKQEFDFEERSTYSIRVQVRDSANNTFAKSLAISVANAPELIGSIVIGDGTVQRSLIKQMSLLFDTQLQIDEGAFIVQRRDFNGAGKLTPTNIPIQVTQVPENDGRYRVVITFTHALNSTTVRQGSLALQDGNYQLIITGSLIRSLSANVPFDANGDGIAGGIMILGDQPSHRFYSFFGDIRGIKAVGAFENNALRKTLGKTSSHPSFDVRFDVDGNGAIGALENNELRRSLSKRVLVWR